MWQLQPNWQRSLVTGTAITNKLCRKMWTVPETVPRPCLINWYSHTWECWICSLCWIFTKNNKCWENFNHICSYRCSFVRTGSNYANPFATYFTRFKVVKKSPGSLVLSYLMLNFLKLFTLFYFQGSYSGFGHMPTVSSGRRRNLVSPTKYCDDLLQGSHPYAPLSLSCFLSLEARPSPICPSWCTHLLLQPCLGIVPFPFCKKILVYKVFMLLWRQLAIFVWHFHFYFYFSEIFIEYSCVLWPSLILHEPEPYSIVIVPPTILKWYWISISKCRHKQCLNVMNHNRKVLKTSISASNIVLLS